MTEYRQNQNTVAENRNSRKPLIIAVGVICALLAILITFLACKNTIFYSTAEKKAENLEFSEAAELVGNVSSEKGDLLSDYLALRADINAVYPMLLAELDMEKINEWSVTAARISQSDAGLSQKITSEAAAIGQKLGVITGCMSEFERIKPEILSLMEIFNEVNRLLTKGPDGKNIGFTAAEEKAKLSQWQIQLAGLSDYAQTVPGGENIYLLTYLIREAQGELSEIADAVDAVTAGGYSDTDLVRFGGSGRKSFPGIQNDKGETVNFLEKEPYVEFMFKEIKRALAENIGEFYIP